MIKSIAIGSFDGIHIAHQELIKRADGVVVIERGFATLTPGWKRSLYTNKSTFFYLLEKIKELTPQEFIKKLQNDFPNLEKIIIGYDFKFGKGKSGDIESIKKYFKGKVEVVNEVKYSGVSVHSRVIRENLQNQNIKLANSMLGRRYRIDGEHIRGLGLGSKELVATINLKVINYTLPDGVFATYTTIKGIKFKSITFIGHRESIDGTHTIETHILEDFDLEIRGKVWIEFVEFIRGVEKFNSLNDLKKQILLDCQKASRILV